MAQVSNFQMNSRILEWKTKVPSSSTSFFDSPTFRLLGSEWYLQFSRLGQQYYGCSNLYGNIVSLVPKVSHPQTLHTPFSVVTYIGHPTDRSQTPVALKWCQIAERKRIEIWNLLDSTGKYDSFGRPQKLGFSGVGEVRIVCLFHDGDSSEVLRDIEPLSSDFSLLLEKSILSDVKLECGGHTFLAHKSVLAARSEVFRAKFQQRMPESETGAIKIQDLDVGVIKNLLRYVYTGKTKDLTEGSAADLYVAARKYAVHSLKTSCTNWIVGNLTVENCLKYLAIAYFQSDRDLGTAVVTFITKNPSVLKSEAWFALSRELPVLANEVFQAYVASTVR